MDVALPDLSVPVLILVGNDPDARAAVMSLPDEIHTVTASSPGQARLEAIDHYLHPGIGPIVVAYLPDALRAVSDGAMTPVQVDPMQAWVLALLPDPDDIATLAAWARTRRALGIQQPIKILDGEAGALLAALDVAAPTT